MLRPLALVLLALVTALPATAQKHDDLGSFEARRRELRQRYIAAASPAEKREIVRLLEALEFEADDEIDRPAAAIETDAAEQEFLDLLLDRDDWTDEELEIAIDAWSRMPDGLRGGIEGIEERTDEEIDGARGSYNHEHDRVRFNEDILEDGVGRGPVPQAEETLYHELIHAFHYDHEADFEEFLALGFDERFERWDREGRSLTAQINSLRAQQMHWLPIVLDGAPNLGEMSPEEIQEFLAASERLREIDAEIERRSAARLDLYRELGFPERTEGDLYAATNEREFVSVVATLLRYEPERLEGRLTPAEIAWLDDYLTASDAR